MRRAIGVGSCWPSECCLPGCFDGRLPDPLQQGHWAVSAQDVFKATRGSSSFHFRKNRYFAKASTPSTNRTTTMIQTRAMPHIIPPPIMSRSEEHTSELQSLM